MYLEAYSEIVRGYTYPPGDALGCPHAVTGAAIDKLMREVDSFRGFPGLYWYVPSSLPRYLCGARN